MAETSAFKRWYSRNKDQFNARRKAKYHSDPDYRSRVLGHVKTNRIRQEESTVRDALTIVDAAVAIGRTPQTIRKWEQDGFIPAVVSKGLHRKYTSHQVMLMEKLARKFDQFRQREATIYDIETVVKEIKELWDVGQNQEDNQV